MKITLKKKHSLVIRWNHWINFPLLTIMIWSGALIYWANPGYGMPQSWLDAIGFNGRLAEGLSWHFTLSFIFILNGVIYASFLFLSGQWRDLFPDKKCFKESIKVILHDFNISKKPLPTFKKYNGAQRFAYTGVLFLGIGATLTGLSIYKPVQLSWLVELLGGYQLARQEHFLITVLFILFFLVHIVQVLKAGWKNFSSMVTGWEKQDDES